MRNSSAGSIDELGEQLTMVLVDVAKGYVNRETRPGEGERLVNEIYSKALSRLLGSEKQ